MHAHLFWAHVEFSAHLASMAGVNWHRGEGVYFLIIVFLLIHSRHQPEVPNFNYIIQCEEDIRGLKDSKKGERVQDAERGGEMLFLRSMDAVVNI